MGGEGEGPKVEPNPKPKIILILGQFGTLKEYIHMKHGTLKNTVFFLFKHRHIQENYLIAVLFILHDITHFTFMLLIYVSFIFTDIVHNKCNSHTFYWRFQSNYVSKKYKLYPKLPWHQIHTLKKLLRLKNDTLKPYTASKNDILKLSEPPIIFFQESQPRFLEQFEN